MKRTAIIIVGLTVVVSTLLAFIGCKPSPPTSPPSPVLIVPNDSVVTAKVLDVIQLEGDVPWRWEMVVEIQASEDVPGLLYNFTKSMVGKTITMKTNENVSELEKGQVITARVRLFGDEHVKSFYWAADIKKRVE